MEDAFSKYIQSVASKFSYTETSEMGYRTDFEDLEYYQKMIVTLTETKRIMKEIEIIEKTPHEN